MSKTIDLYDSAYRNYAQDLYAQIRTETYGEDLGQSSWVTNEESNAIPGLLGIKRGWHVLEAGCGSGRYALRVAEQTGCRVTAIDINPHGVRNARELARASDRYSLVEFEEADLSRELPFGDETFDAIFSNDVLCHVPGRAEVLRELSRILRPGGRLLFSDALVIGGFVSNEEIATRSSIGVYVFSPPGTNETVVEAAGLQMLETRDTTANAAQIAGRWREARHKRSAELAALEGAANFDGLQQFLACTQKLAQERRLLRRVYVACKPARA